jgi:hypothetical protein
VASDDFLQFDDTVSPGSGYHAAACNLIAPIY